MARKPDLAHQREIERRAQGPGDDGGHRYAAARERQNYRSPGVEVGQAFEQPSPRVGSVDEHASSPLSRSASSGLGGKRPTRSLTAVKDAGRRPGFYPFTDRFHVSSASTRFFESPTGSGRSTVSHVRPRAVVMSNASADFRFGSSAHETGTATGAPGRALSENGAIAVAPRSLRSQSMKMRPCRFAFDIS